MPEATRGYQVLRAGSPAGGAARQAVVFVHGIFSSHRTFDHMRQRMENDPGFAAWEIGAFDYDFYQTIPYSGVLLRQALTEHFAPPDRVTLVCHSMGGLVARFAILGGDVECVERIVMLGTPNFGSLTASQLGLLSQMTVAVTGRLWATFPRKTGLRDLTRVTRVFDEFYRDSSVDRSRAERVEYVTIPGMYFHRDRDVLDAVRHAGGFGIMSAVNLVTAKYRYWKVSLAVPHDGIVEEQSVCLIPTQAGHYSEKSPAILEPARFGGSKYAHVTPYASRELTHVLIQSDPTVIGVVEGILKAGSALAWKRSLPNADLYAFDSIRIPGEELVPAGGAATSLGLHRDLVARP